MFLSKNQQVSAQCIISKGRDGISEEELVYSSFDEEEDQYNKAEDAWHIGKEVGLAADDENVIIQLLMEDYLEKKNTSRSKLKKKGCGRKKARANKTGVNLSFP